MLSCGCEPPTVEIALGENEGEMVGVQLQSPSGPESPSHVTVLGVGVSSTTPPDASSCTVMVCVCCGVWAVVSVIKVEPWICPIVVLKPLAGPLVGLPQCIGTWPCRFGRLKVV